MKATPKTKDILESRKVPVTFIAEVQDYHEFDVIKAYLKNFVGLSYSFKEHGDVSDDGFYIATFKLNKIRK
jgi:hypothetical protein